MHCLLHLNLYIADSSPDMISLYYIKQTTGPFNAPETIIKRKGIQHKCIYNMRTLHCYGSALIVNSNTLATLYSLEASALVELSALCHIQRQCQHRRGQDNEQTAALHWNVIYTPQCYEKSNKIEMIESQCRYAVHVPQRSVFGYMVELYMQIAPLYAIVTQPTHTVGKGI